jgi:hypothetical protein
MTEPDDIIDDNEPYVPVGIGGLVAASEKLLAVNRGLEDPDEREALGFKKILRLPDQIAERIRLDTTQSRRKLVRLAAKRRSLQHVMPLFMDDEASGAFIGNPLGSPIEEINPMQTLEQARRITAMGPGGIGSPESITLSMQAVHPSQFGFISPVEGPECFDAQTEVYTARGWVKWPDVKDDEIFACNQAGRLVWCAASRIVRTKYKGRMILGENESIRMCVTPNHRVLNTRDINYRWDTAEEVFAKTIKIPITHGAYQGKNTSEFFTLASVAKTNSNQRAFDKFDLGDWAEYLGWWLAEGSLFLGERNGQKVGQVRVHQCPITNPGNHERIRQLMIRMGLMGENAQKRNNNLSASCKQLWNYFSQWSAGCYDKWIPEECFEWPAEARSRMLHALLWGDGRFNKKRMAYCTVSWRLACSVEKLAISLGFPAFIRIEADRRERVTTTNYVVSISRAKNRTLKSRTHKHSNGKFYGAYWSDFTYDGTVYCATVPGGMLLVRGKPGTAGFWSGNSERAGIDVRVAMGVKIGSNGRLYRKMLNPRTGDWHWVSPEDLMDKTVQLPD